MGKSDGQPGLSELPPQAGMLEKSLVTPKVVMFSVGADPTVLPRATGIIHVLL